MQEAYLNFSLHRVMPSNRPDSIRVKEKSQRFFVQENQIDRGGFNQAPLRCLPGKEVIKVLKEIHARVCKHQGCSKLYKQLSTVYY